MGHACTEEKDDDTKNKENIFCGTIEKYSLHGTTSDNGFRLIDFAAGRNVVLPVPSS